MSGVALTLTGVRVTYSGTARDVDALAGIDLAVAPGESLALIGPSGCGKSTLLLAIAGLVSPSAGAIRIGSDEVTGPRRRTALILQDFGLLPWKTVAHNAALGLELRRVPRAERETRTTEALARMGLAEFADAYPGELSGGMKQRLALARALAIDADVLLLDEPLSALDALIREDLQELLLDVWRQRGHTAVLVTHSIEEAVFLGTRVAVMTPRPGRISAIIDNPGAGAPNFRTSAAFHEQCDRLRSLLTKVGRS